MYVRMFLKWRTYYLHTHINVHVYTQDGSLQSGPGMLKKPEKAVRMFCASSMLIQKSCLVCLGGGNITMFDIA